MLDRETLQDGPVQGDLRTPCRASSIITSGVERTTPHVPGRISGPVDFLDNNPEYLHDMPVLLLMPDLIALPEQFAQLDVLVMELSASFHSALACPPQESPDDFTILDRLILIHAIRRGPPRPRSECFQSGL